MKRPYRKLCLATVAVLALNTPAVSYASADDQTDQPAENTGVFGLGQIVVTSSHPAPIGIDSSTISEEAIEAFARENVADAVNLLPNVNLGNTGGSRNERLIFVRGFDRFQVPLSIDGVRVFRPADNRLDFGQFLTADLAEVQVAKGYASVLDGPGAMGGAINLVTKRPSQAFEADVRATLNLDRGLDYAGYSVAGRVGTAQDSWYAQASFARHDREHWALPGSFVPLTANEDGGDRDFSEAEDWRVNLKVGFTPNATDEYTLSYTKQDGSKNAPLHISDSTTNVSLRNWNWPSSTIESVYFLSKTALSDVVTLKSQLYHTSFDNLLQSFDNREQNSQLLNRAFDSPYWDTAYGGALQLGFAVSQSNQLTFAAHYRHDEHKEAQTSRPDATNTVTEPVQVNQEQTWSLAVEDRQELTPKLALTVGLSYDWREVARAEDYNTTDGVYSHPTKNSDGWNGQARLDWRGDDLEELYLSLSSRIRFPTVFERYSSQFGTAVANADLKPERATNAELGGSRVFGPLRLSGAVFYSWLSDALVSVRMAGNVNQRQNIGSARYYGAELALDAQVTPTLSVGANYGYIHRSFDIGEASGGGFIREFRLTDVPDHKGVFYAEWKPIPQLTVMPTVDWASSRTTVTPATANGDTPLYYSTGSYVLANLRADYAISEGVSIGVGVRNLFDEYYTLTDGFPEAGRSYFVTSQMKF